MAETETPTGIKGGPHCNGSTAPDVEPWHPLAAVVPSMTLSSATVLQFLRSVIVAILYSFLKSSSAAPASLAFPLQSFYVQISFV